MPDWDSKLYLRFAAERAQPARDLIARLEIETPKRILDLGCGPGNSAALLRQRWPEATLIGLDNSPEMIAAAREKYPSADWILGDAATYADAAGFDLVFSNAALHWLPHHAALMPHWFGQVKDGGALAVQMPAHYDSALHRLIHKIADAPEWSSQMDDARRAIKTETAEFYYEVLASLSSRLDVWETRYFHVLENAEAILEWIRATGLRPFLAALPNPEQKRGFEALLLDGLREAYLPRADGRICFPFRRLFFVAYR